MHGFASGNAIGLYGVSGGVGPALRLLGGTGSAAIIESTGPTNTADMVVINNAGSGDLVQASTGGLTRFRVTWSGAVQADGAYTSPAADVAEFIDTDETPHAGRRRRDRSFGHRQLSPHHHGLSERPDRGRRPPRRVEPPGHAMRAPETPSPGTVIGKALGPHTGEGAGVIEMLVMLR